jgi:TrmH family RNA methyltransferase
MSTRLRPYKKDADYSYTLGLFPTLELLQHRPEAVSRVLVSSKAADSEGVAKIRALCGAHDLPVEVADAQIQRLAHAENCYAVGVFAKYEAPLSPRHNHLVLVHPEDSGNLGTIVRTMLGFDVADLAIVRPAVDLFAPRTVRASMGALFQLRYAYYDDFEAYAREFGGQGGHTLYPLMTDGAQTAAETHFRAPWSLVFGPEAAGLPPEFQQWGPSVRIPQSGRIDSLNLAVAVGIALYASSALD